MSIVYGDDKLVRGAELIELYQDAEWTLAAGRAPGEVEDSVRQSPVFITAREGARLVGFASALTDRVFYAHVTEFLVRSSHRGRGIGGELMRRVLEAVPRERAVSIFAEPDALEFYRGHGFQPIGGGLMLRR